MKDYVITSHGLRIPNFPGSGCPPYKPEVLVEHPPKAGEVSRAELHLKKFWVSAKTANKNSYHLKHAVERTIGGYCANGALIQAAENLGLRIEPDGGGINAKIYVKRNRDAWKEFNAAHPHGISRWVDSDEITLDSP